MIEEDTAYSITYASLGVFALTACAAAHFVYKPKEVKQGWSERDAIADHWYSARNTQGWVSLGLSYFASSMGAWVLFAAPEVGTSAGWWGVVGYALASSLPFVGMCVLGPMVRRLHGEGFCLTDWVLKRFGRAVQLYVGLVSVFYMWVYLVAELTSMGNLISTFAGLDPLNALVPMSLVTMLYTMLAGLPASIWTDRLQGVMMLIVIVLILVTCFSGLDIGERQWRRVAGWSDRGFESLVTLIWAIMGAELFNMAGWQRVYAARSEKDLRKGLLFGVSLIFPVMLLFGVAGMLAQAQDLSRETPRIPYPAFAFFDLLAGQATWVAVMAYALATCMVASSVDSLQTGLLSVLSMEAKKLSPGRAMIMGQIFVAAVNIPAIALAAEATKDVLLGVNIIDLFLVADLLTLSMAAPIFMGLGSMATQGGALAGCVSGVLVIFAFGWVEFGTFAAGLEMVTLMAFDQIANVLPEEKGLTARRSSILFFVLPFVTGSVTYVVSWMERVHEHMAFAALGQSAQVKPKVKAEKLEELKAEEQEENGRDMFSVSK